MRPRELHSDYYRDRWSESDLCNDFPGDEILIDGLHAMQTHMWNNGVYIDIPVVRVMNTAHFLAAYMFATTCSGDRTEYDALADISLGRDKQMFRVTMIVLAAMLARTEGFRARQCRNLILDNRDPDFEEGVTLYDRFLRSAEKRFSEEDFLIDTHTQIQRLTAENEQLIEENKALRYKYQLMENQQNIQYSNCVIYNAPVYNTNTTNNYYPPQATSDSKKEQAAEDITPIDTSFFGTDRYTADICEKNLRAAINEASGKADACRRIMLADTCGYIHIRQFSDARKAELINQFSAPKYIFTDDDFCKARNRMNAK